MANNNINVEQSLDTKNDQEEDKKVSYKDDLRIAAYIQRTELADLRQKRNEYVSYKNNYKQKMVQFLSSIFMHPVDTQHVDENNKPIQLIPQKFSVFEGISSSQLPTLDIIQSLVEQQNIRNNIFLQEKSPNRLEHEKLMNSKL
jgi:hypothetical protein